MGNTPLQPEPQSSDTTLLQKLKVPIRLCGTTPIDVVPAEYYVEELWAALDQTLLRSACGVGSDTPLGQGGTLDMKTFKISLCHVILLLEYQSHQSIFQR